MRERKRGAFYRGGSGFLHFHEDPEGFFADLKLQEGGDFTRFRVSTAAERKRFLSPRAQSRRVMSTFLCRTDEIAEGEANSIILGEGRERRDIVVVRRGGRFYAYLNSCPHQAMPLETFPDKFLNEDGIALRLLDPRRQISRRRRLLHHRAVRRQRRCAALEIADRR